MRDRLIELLKGAETKVIEELSRPLALEEWLGVYADHLLANGVIVPPCKVGDDVYLIPTYNGKPYCGVCKDKVQMIGITSRGVHIKAREHHDNNKMYMLGKSIFLTKEEAERALKERERK